MQFVSECAVFQMLLFKTYVYLCISFPLISLLTDMLLKHFQGWVVLYEKYQ